LEALEYPLNALVFTFRTNYPLPLKIFHQKQTGKFM